MSEHTIQCWSCGTRKTLEEIRTADGYCPECEVEIDLAEYYPKLAGDYDALQSRLDEAEANYKREAKNDAIAYKAALEKQDELRRQLAELRSRVAEMERDAERYRWLRERCFSFSHDEAERGISTMRWGEWYYDIPESHSAQMDMAIDAAMAEQQDGEGVV